MTTGAIFARQFHRSAPRKRVHNTVTKQEVSSTTVKRTAAKATDLEAKPTAANTTNWETTTRDLNDEIWKAYGVDDGWGPWFLVP